MTEFTRVRQRYEMELCERIIPFWEKYSIDHEYGGFFSCLERDGTVYDTLKQMWMQWREVYMFAALYNSTFCQERYLEYARNGFGFLYRHGRKKDGSYHYLLNRAGDAVADSEGGAEIFTESFAAIACAELYRATKEEKYHEEALSCWKVFRENVEAAESTVAEYPGRVVRKQLAFPMIALNVLLVMRRAFGVEIPDSMIQATIASIQSFSHPDSGIIFERILPDGSFDLNSQDGRFINPGHALEGLSFIMDYDDIHYGKNNREWVLQRTKDMIEYGWDHEYGGVFYFRDILDKPLVKNECMLKAWWPQNEAATAMLQAFAISKDRFFWNYFKKIDAFAWANLRDPEYPEWFAYAAVEGRQVHSYKGSRWKTFFHLPRHLLKSVEILYSIRAKF